MPTKLSDEELRELLLQTFLEIQKDLQERGALPRGDQTVLARFRGFFEFVGAIQLGLLIASGSILLIFVVTRLILHLDLARIFSA